MRGWIALAMFLSGASLYAAEPGDASQRVTLSVELGRPILASADWSSGDLAASVDLDLPIRGNLTLAASSGGIWDARNSYEHDTVKLDLQYLGVGLRLTSQPAGAVRAFCVVEAALLHSELTDEFSYFNLWGRTRRSSWDGAGLFGAGFVAGDRPRGPWWLFEVRGLVPLTSDRQADLPSLGVAFVGVRFRL